MKCFGVCCVSSTSGTLPFDPSTAMALSSALLGVENKNKTKLDNDDKPSFGHCCVPRTRSTFGNVEPSLSQWGTNAVWFLCTSLPPPLSIHLFLYKLPDHTTSSVVNENSLYISLSLCHIYPSFQTFHSPSSSPCLNHCWIITGASAVCLGCHACVWICRSGHLPFLSCLALPRWA